MVQESIKWQTFHSGVYVERAQGSTKMAYSRQEGVRQEQED